MSFWAICVLSWLVVAAVASYCIISNPDHWTAEYPKHMELNGRVLYMSATEEYVFVFAFLAFFLSAIAGVSLAKYLRDVGNDK